MQPDLPGTAMIICKVPYQILHALLVLMSPTPRIFLELGQRHIFVGHVYKVAVAVAAQERAYHTGKNATPTCSSC